MKFEAVSIRAESDSHRFILTLGLQPTRLEPLSVRSLALVAMARVFAFALLLVLGAADVPTPVAQPEVAAPTEETPATPETPAAPVEEPAAPVEESWRDCSVETVCCTCS